MNNLINDYNKFHKILIDKINEPLLIINQELVCINANKCFFDIFRMSANEIINVYCKNFFNDFFVDKNIYEATLNRINDISVNVIINQEIIEILDEKYYLLRVSSYDDRIIRSLNHEELNVLFNNDVFGIIVTDKNRKIKIVNDVFVKKTGISVSDLIGKSMSMFYKSDVEYEKNMKLYDNRIVKLEFDFKNKLDSEMKLEISGFRIERFGEESFVWIINDITERIEILNELKNTNLELQSILDNSVVGILVVEGSRIVKSANKFFAETLGYDSTEELVGKSVSEFHLSEEKFIEFGKNYFQNLVNHKTIAVDYQFKKRDGSLVWVAISGRAIDDNVPPDLNKGVVWACVDITKRVENEKILEYMAKTDEMTDIFNRRYFMELGQREINISRRTNMPLTIFMIDIDDFKTINDKYGHAMGDKIIKEFAISCKKILRKTDIFARIGGDEFAILFPNTNIKNAVNLSKRLVNKIILLDEKYPFNISVSIGIVENVNFDKIELLLKKADEKLYSAKNKGKNCVDY